MPDGIRDADLRGAILNGVFFNAGLAEDDSNLLFGPADLIGAVLRGAKLQGANLDGVDMTGADVSGANFGSPVVVDEDKGTAWETIVTREQLLSACADPDNPPILPDRPEFKRLVLPPCPAAD